MQLRRLRLTNLRSYVSADLRLDPGTTLISGDVGSGKTSLLYAIEMALFGFAEVDAVHLVRHRAPHAEVALTLEADGHEYELARRFRRKARKGREIFELEQSSFAVDGARKNYSATELRQRVIELLGFPDNPSPQAHSDLWRWAVYVPQESMREVLAQNPQQRLETVRRALGVERYRTAAENAQLLSSELRRRAADVETNAGRLSHWEDDLVQAGTALAGLESEAARQGEETQRIQLELSTLEDRLAALESDLRAGAADDRETQSLLLRLEEDHDALQVQEARREELNADVSRAEQELDELVLAAHSVETESTQADQARDELSALRERVVTAERQRTARALAEAEVERAKKALRADLELASQAVAEVADLGRQLAELNQRSPTREPPAPTHRSVPEIEASIHQLRTQELEASSRTSECRANLDQIADLLREGTCPRCHQKVDPSGFAGHRKEAEVALQAAADEAQQLGVVLRRAEQERSARERFERAWTRWEELQNHRRAAKENLERADARSHRATEAVAESTHALEEAMKVRGQLPEVSEDSDQLDEEVQRIESVLRERERRLRELTALLQRVEGIRETNLQRRREISRIEEEVAVLRSRRASNQQSLQALEARIRERSSVGAAFERNRQRLEEGRNQRLTLAARQARTQALREETDRKIGEASKGIAERQRLTKEAERLRSAEGFLSGPFQDEVLVMEEKLLGQAQRIFERDFVRFFSALVDDPGILARSDGAFTPAVEIDGEWTPAEALSGGERTALALAFRLALGRVVRALGQLRLETLLLDEPTEGFSPEQVLRMGELLDELSLPQVVIVSHESQLAGVADREIRVEKEAGVSRFSGARDAAKAKEKPPVQVEERSSSRPRATRRAPTLDPYLAAE